MGGEEVVEVGGSVEGGSTGGIYRGSSVEQCGAVWYLQMGLECVVVGRPSG